MLTCIECNKSFEFYEDNDSLCKGCQIKHLRKLFSKPIAIDQQYLYQLLSAHLLSLEGNFKEISEDNGLEEEFISKSQLAEAISKILNVVGKDLSKEK